MRTTATILQVQSGYLLDDKRLQRPPDPQQLVLTATACLAFAALVLLTLRWCCMREATQADHIKPLIDNACHDDHYQAVSISSPFASLEAQTQNWSPQSTGSTSQYAKHQQQAMMFEVRQGMASTVTDTTTDNQPSHKQNWVSSGGFNSSGSNNYSDYNQHQPSELDLNAYGKGGILQRQQVQQQEADAPAPPEIQPYQELRLPQPEPYMSDNLVHPLPGQLLLGTATNIASVAQRASPRLPSVPLPMPGTIAETEPEIAQPTNEASIHLTSFASRWSSGSSSTDMKEESQLTSARHSLSSVTSSNSGFAMSLGQPCLANRHWPALASVPEGDEPSFAAGLLASRPALADQEHEMKDSQVAAVCPGLAITLFHGQLSTMTAMQQTRLVGDISSSAAAACNVMATKQPPLQTTLDNVVDVVMSGSAHHTEDAGKPETSKVQEVGLPSTSVGRAGQATGYDVAFNPDPVNAVAEEQVETAKYPALTVQTAVAMGAAPDLPLELQAGNTVADRIQSLASLAVDMPRCSPMPSLQLATGSPTSETRELAVPLMRPTPSGSLTATSMLREESMTREVGPNAGSATTVSGFEVRHATYRPPPSPVRRSLLTVASLTPPATDSCRTGM